MKTKRIWKSIPIKETSKIRLKMQCEFCKDIQYFNWEYEDLCCHKTACEGIFQLIEFQILKEEEGK